MNQQTLVALARRERRTFVAALEHGLARAQVQVSHLQRFAVALEALLLQNREHIFCCYRSCLSDQ